VVILNDMLHVRKFYKLPAVAAVTLSYMATPNPSPLTSPAATASMPTPLLPGTPVGGSLMPAAIPGTPSAQDQAVLVTKFCQVTGMKPEVAKECLQANSWNGDQALQTLRALKVS
jgi:hypothetical protein